jgi:hypothetical protein
LRLDNFIQILVPVFDSIANELSSNFFSEVRNGSPGDVDCGRVERSCTHCRGSNLRKIFGGVNFLRLRDGSIAVGLVAKVIESLYFDLVSGVKVLALDANNIKANVAKVLKSFLLKVTLGIKA